MSDHDRRKKDGEDKNKENQQMRAAEAERHQDSGGDAPDADRKDTTHPQRGRDKVEQTAGSQS